MLADGPTEPLAPQAHENEAMAEAVREHEVETLLRYNAFLGLSGRTMVLPGMSDALAAARCAGSRVGGEMELPRVVLCTRLLTMELLHSPQLPTNPTTETETETAANKEGKGKDREREREREKKRVKERDTERERERERQRKIPRWRQRQIQTKKEKGERE